MRREVFFPVLVALLMASSGRVGAEERSELDECVRAYDESQVLRRSGKLRDAGRLLLRCAQESCPRVVVSDCARWLREVKESQPTVVFSVRDWEGNDLQDVKVLVDGQVVAERLEGLAIAVDPGPRVIRFLALGREPVDQSLVIREGEKNRKLEIVLQKGKQQGPSDASVSTGQSSWARPAPLLLGGLAVLGLASFTYFGLGARRDVRNMENYCSPNCSDEDVDAARMKAMVADVSLGVGIAAAAAAVVTLTWGDSGESSNAPRRALRVSPGSIAFSGTF